MWKNFEKLQYTSCKERIGTLYMGMNAKRTTALAYSIIFLIRRFIFALLTFTMTSLPHMQIQAFCVISVLYLCYLSHSMLFESYFSSRLEIFNEVVFLLLCYHMVLFANLVNDFQVRENIGWSFIYTGVVLVAVNLIVILGANLVTLK